MLEQMTGRIVVAVVYIINIETEALSSIVSGDKCVGGMVVDLIEHVTGFDIVLIIFVYGIHRTAPH